MTLLDVLVAALVRGIGEVLPVGGSGALAALPGLTGGPDALRAISVAAHLGIATALAVYFHHDVRAMARGLWRLIKGKPDQGSHLLLLVMAGTLPAAIAGWLLIDRLDGLIGPVTASVLILGGGILLAVADKLGVTVHRIEHLGYGGAAILGALQVLALFPGASRTGLVITMARLMGWERADAARLTLLLALPLLSGHAVHALWSLAGKGELILSTDLALAALVACVAALPTVAVMMTWVERRSFMPFALARIGLGVAVLILSLSG